MSGINKKNKRWTAVMLAMSLSFASAPMMAGAETVQAGLLTQDQAVEKVKQMLPLLKDYKLESAQNNDHYFQQGSDDSVWIFTWGKTAFADRSNVNTVVSAKTGEILSINMWDNAPQQVDGGISREEALAKAKEWIEKLEPSKAGFVQEMDKEQDGGLLPREKMENGYSFRFVRVVNGIPCPSDGFTITMDQQGQLRNYNFTWIIPDDQLPGIDSVLEKEKAIASYKDQLPLRLQYNPVFLPDSKKPEMHLVYTSQSSVSPYGDINGLPMMDAITGKLISPTGEEIKVRGNPLPLADQAASPPAKGAVDKDTAIQLAKGYTKIIDNSYSLQGSEFNNWQNQNQVWQFTWVKGKDERNGLVQISIDAKTGELRDLYVQKPFDNSHPSAQLSLADAKEKAIAFIKKAAPTKLNALALMDGNETTPIDSRRNGYRFQFAALVNGIPTEEGSISITVDGQSGEVIQYNTLQGTSDYQNLNYPSPTKAMPVDAAKAKFMEKFPLELQYVRLMEKGSEPWKGQPRWGKVILVYGPPRTSSATNLDAVSGEWLTPWGQQIDHKKASDIQGHWAEKELQELINRGALPLEGDKVKPDEVVSRGEAIRILILGLSLPRSAENKMAAYQDVLPSDPNYEYIESAVMMGWLPRDIEEFHPKETLQREQLAAWATHILGYGELSSKKDIFVKPFSDLTDEDDSYLGAIAIVKGLGLMSGDGTNFHPRGEVTRAQMAYVVYHMAKHMRNTPSLYLYGRK